MERPTRPATTSAEEKVTTETSTDESESETTVTTTEKAEAEEKDKDKEEEATTETAPAEENATEAPTEEESEAATAPLPASAYPDVTISLDINENSEHKFDITLTMDGRYDSYAYTLHRIFADGTDNVIASGESGETHIKLATVDSLTQTQTIDRLVITAYYKSVPGNKVTLDLKEPLA